MTSVVDPWLRRYREVPGARLRLVCLPYAGGAANVFRLWHKRLPEDVELLAVQYAGRQDRLSEPAVDDMGTLVAEITAALTQLPARPLVLFGHSMGASVAYEVAQRMAAQLLVVSGHNAPHRADDKPVPRTDAEVIAEIREVEGTHEALADPDLRELAMPSLRADYRLIRGYLPASQIMISAPIVGYTGLGDTSVTLEQVRAWAELTTAGFELVSFPGKHFFLETDADAVLADLAARLTG